MPTAITRRTVGRPTNDPARDTRKLLLAAATELFAQNGVAATTFAMIARKANLTPAMVHYHFDDRDHLLDAIVDDLIAPNIRYIWEPVTPGQPPVELVSGFVTRLLDVIERVPWLPSLWLREVMNDGGLLRDRLIRKLPFEKLALFVASLAEGQPRGTVNEGILPQLTPFSALGLVMLHVATRKVWSETFQQPQPDNQDLHRHISSLLQYGVSGNPRTAKPQQETTRGNHA